MDHILISQWNTVISRKLQKLTWHLLGTHQPPICNFALLEVRTISSEVGFLQYSIILNATYRVKLSNKNMHCTIYIFDEPPSAILASPLSLLTNPLGRINDNGWGFLKIFVHYHKTYNYIRKIINIFKY